MNRTARAGVVTAAVVALLGAAGGGYALAGPDAAAAGPVTTTDHTRVTFTVAPGGTATFQVPVAGLPVRMDIASPSTNAGLQNPSSVFGALVTVDKLANGVTWIGTDSDGTSKAGATFSTGEVAHLTCGASCTIATLSVVDPATRTFAITTNRATTTIKEKFVVNLWY